MDNEWIDATGDVVQGDIIRFTESVFSGSYKNPKVEGNRTITGEIMDDSYGANKQQHTFSIRVLECIGLKAEDVLSKAKRSKKGTIRRMGRNVYRQGTERKRWADEFLRQDAIEEKHDRGSVARALREERKESEAFYVRW